MKKPKVGVTRRRTHSTPLAVAVVLGGFAFIAVISVIAIGAWTSYRNTVDLLREKGELVVNAAVERMHLHLTAAEEQVAFVAGTIEGWASDPGDTEHFVSLISGALAATPQITALHYIDLHHRLVGAEREGKAAVPVFAGLSLDPDARQIIDEARTRTSAWWADFLWKDEYKALQVNLRYPVRREGELIGVMMALISVPSLSAIIADMENDFGYNAFILIDRERVLAHPLLQFGMPGLDRWHPLPTLTELGDPVLMSIWDVDARNQRLSAFLNAERGHIVRLGDNEHVIVYKEITGYGPRPWIFGSHLRTTGLADEVPRLLAAVAACAVVLVIVVAGAALLGRRIAAPAVRLAEAAENLRQLDFERIRPVGGSAFREMNAAGAAFDTMAPVVEMMASYAPGNLIARLEGRGISPTEPPRPVVATAIVVGVLPDETSEGQDVGAVVAERLDAMAALIQEAEGILESCAGSTMIAWWDNHPERPDHAVQAVSVAQRILRAERQRRSSGKGSARISIGLHTGEGMAGFFRTGGRGGYCLRGEPSILAAALQDHAAAFPLTDEGECGVALCSAETVRAAAAGALSIGQHPVAWRTMELFRLV